jgi:hypothetical protein
LALYFVGLSAMTFFARDAVVRGARSGLLERPSVSAAGAPGEPAQIAFLALTRRIAALTPAASAAAILGCS